VLTRVTQPDGSYYTFGYTSWGQVWQIERYASDGHPLAYSAYNLPGSPLLATSAQTDCPRFSEEHEWAQNWSGINGVPTEVITSYSINHSASWTKPEDGSAQSGQMTQITTPDGTVMKTYSHASGWDSGLPLLVQTFSVDDLTNPKRWVSTAWTQDNTSVSYPLSPRLSETNIYDPSNRKRTTFGYYTYTLPNGGACSVPTDEYDYAANASTIYRHTQKGWMLDTAYTTRGFIGLLHQVDVYDGSSALVARTTYWYDYGGECMSATATPVVQHDSSFDVNFLTGRGNLVLEIHYDAKNDPINQNNTAEQFTTGYNTTGSVTITHDFYWHQRSLIYADSFADGINHNAWAYPTVIKDEENNQSSIKYDYNLSAPQGSSSGPIQTLAYDGAGRISQVTTQFNGNTSYSYKRWVYLDSVNAVQTFALELGKKLIYVDQMTPEDDEIIKRVEARTSQSGRTFQRESFEDVLYRGS
jgi:hypothetical protein